MKLCECGCLQPAPIAKRSYAGKGVTKGDHLRFIRGHQNKRENSGNWKGGVRKTSNGYVEVLDRRPGRKHEYIGEHVLKAESALGRPLPPKAQVHHVNEKRSDNRGLNLVICEDHAYHMTLHRRERAYRATGDANKRMCTYCKEWGDDLENRGHASYHKECMNEYSRRRYHEKKGNSK